MQSAWGLLCVGLKLSTNPSPVMLFIFYLFEDAYCEGSPHTHGLRCADPSWTVFFLLQIIGKTPQ